MASNKNGGTPYISWWKKNPTKAVWAQYGIAALVYIILLFLLTGLLWIIRNTFEVHINGWAFVGTILALYTYPLSIPSIPAGKRAALLVLGKPIRNLKSGPAFVPFLIFSKEEFSSEAIQFEIPHDKELKERYTGKDHQK